VSKIIYAILLSFLLSSIIGAILIPLFKRLKLGQNIREEGPKSHYKKAATPTFGGIIFIFSSIITMLFFIKQYNKEFKFVFYSLIVFGFIGFLDDFLKKIHKKNEGLMTLALDRINTIEEMGKNSYKEYTGVDFERYFSDTIGVTKTQKDRGQRVILQVNAKNAPYVATKPLHPSQQILDKKEDGSILIRIDVVLNFELEREILGFGESIKVLSPRNLQTRIKQRLTAATELYAEKSVDKISNSQHE